jgi:hypothetical protein
VEGKAWFSSTALTPSPHLDRNSSCSHCDITPPTSVHDDGQEKNLGHPPALALATLGRQKVRLAARDSVGGEARQGAGEGEQRGHDRAQDQALLFYIKHGSTDHDSRSYTVPHPTPTLHPKSPTHRRQARLRLGCRPRRRRNRLLHMEG